MNTSRCSISQRFRTSQTFQKFQTKLDRLLHAAFERLLSPHRRWQICGGGAATLDPVPRCVGHDRASASHTRPSTRPGTDLWNASASPAAF